MQWAEPRSKTSDCRAGLQSCRARSSSRRTALEPGLLLHDSECEEQDQASQWASTRYAGLQMEWRRCPWGLSATKQYFDRSQGSAKFGLKEDARQFRQDGRSVEVLWQPCTQNLGPEGFESCKAEHPAKVSQGVVEHSGREYSSHWSSTWDRCLAKYTEAGEPYKGWFARHRDMANMTQHTALLPSQHWGLGWHRRRTQCRLGKMNIVESSGGCISTALVHSSGDDLQGVDRENIEEVPASLEVQSILPQSR